jgi:hypothetical protein
MYNCHVKPVYYDINISANMINNVGLTEILTLTVGSGLTFFKYTILGFMKRVNTVGLPFI